MMATPRFCTTCGNALAEGVRFCSKCGTAALAEAAAPPPPPPPTAPVQSAAPPPPPTAPVPNGEHAIAVISNTSLKTGLIKRTNYALVLTDRRVVFAEITAAMLKQAVSDARDDAKADGKGLFGQWGAQLGAYSDMAGSYLAMTPEQALAQNPANFAVDRAAIKSCKLKHGRVGNDDAPDSPDRLVIKTTGGDKYNLELGAGIGQAKKALVAAAMI